MPVDKTGKQVLEYLDKIDFKMNAVKKDEEGHYLMLKEAIQEEDINNSQYICP